jgi:hypothetical protein
MYSQVSAELIRSDVGGDPNMKSPGGDVGGEPGGEDNQS